MNPVEIILTLFIIGGISLLLPVFYHHHKGTFKGVKNE